MLNVSSRPVDYINELLNRGLPNFYRIELVRELCDFANEMWYRMVLFREEHRVPLVRPPEMEEDQLVGRYDVLTETLPARVWSADYRRPVTVGHALDFPRIMEMRANLLHDAGFVLDTVGNPIPITYWAPPRTLTVGDDRSTGERTLTIGAEALDIAYDREARRDLFFYNGSQWTRIETELLSTRVPVVPKKEQEKSVPVLHRYAYLELDKGDE